MIVSAVEHKGVLETAHQLRDLFGFELTELPVDAAGRVSPAGLAAAIRPDTLIVSIMAANNEVGTVQPLAELAAVCRERGVPLHSDAVQASGTLSLKVDELGVDLLSLGAHKFYGPKGIGLLYVRRGVPVLPQVTGGSQEGKRRAGTENVPFVVGLARALELSQAERAAEASRLMALRDRLIDGVLAAVPDCYLTGHRTERLANHASFIVRGIEAEGMLIGLDMAGICASSGSACTSGAQEPSHVLTAMGIPRQEAAGHLRLSLGHSNGEADVERLLEVLPPLVARLRELSPFAVRDSDRAHRPSARDPRSIHWGAYIPSTRIDSRFRRGGSADFRRVLAVLPPFSCHTLSPVLNYHGGAGRRSQRRPAHFLLLLFIPDLWRLVHVERQVS